ncbi:cryptochrome/photolyase family protein [Gordonia aichiensis]|uniref:cryptochrome/photolyase family protein n=1 Tax=Gordonia aichiensis TaxID=36820 RepID=UPI00326675EB
MSAPAIVWFRRDLRLSDLPTLLAAADHTDTALAVFVLDDALLTPSGAPRVAFLTGCLRALDAALDGRLLLVAGDPVQQLPRLAAAVDAQAVHISADFGPYGSARDRAVEAALAALPTPVPLIRTGSPYAVSPGRIHTKTGRPYQVFTPYRRAWLDHGWHTPARTGPDTLDWLDPATTRGLPEAAALPEPREDAAALNSPGEDAAPLNSPGEDAAPLNSPGEDAAPLNSPGEDAARLRWHAFRHGPHSSLDRYADDRDRPDLDTTTRLSPYLKFGCIHPRTLLHDIRTRTDPGAVTLRSELAWRDFYADVLHHRPDTARGNYNPKFDGLEYDAGPTADAAFDAWRTGRTGYPIVDAGMRQLLAQGWMHNRVRMIVASFLTKDLHLPWWRGARHFMTCLVDGDLASNQHGWQWTAGCGTDAAPYFRVFNPITQGERFDPTGDYVRRWVPELRDIEGRAVHRPWKQPDTGLFDAGARRAYPAPIVDHALERQEALDRYARL